nr:Transposon Ty3-I Gag-Pol polyprotein [Ipomoea batatas]
MSREKSEVAEPEWLRGSEHQRGERQSVGEKETLDFDGGVWMRGLRLFIQTFWDAHLRHVEIAFQLLRANQLYLKFSKCAFGLQELLYLGHIVSVTGVKVDPSKIQAMLDWPVPSSVTDLRGFLGLIGYYRKFVHNYGNIAKPLTDLLRKGRFVWTDAALEAFTRLKEAMVTAPTLVMPDFSYPFTIERDASGCGIGAVLSQRGHPIAFMSQALGRSKLSWSIYAKEMLAILTAIRLWRPYLLGRRFYILTDQKSLKYLLEQRIGTPEQHNWVAKLLGYDYEILYRPGRANQAADALSRCSHRVDDDGLHSASPVIMTISTAHATTRDQLTQEVQSDPYLQKLVIKSLQNPDGPYSMRNGLATGNATVTPAESTPLEKLSPAAVDVVAETPTDEPNRSAMQIETDGVPVSGAGMEPPAPTAEALPRSYLDSVVGNGASAAPFLMASLSDEDDAADLSGDDDLAVNSESGQPMTGQDLSPAHTATPVVNTNVGTNAAQRTKPYGSWMLVTRKERRQPAQTSGPSNRAPVGGAGNERGAVGSRYAPLEMEDGSGAVPANAAQTQPSRRPDKQPAVSGSGAVRQQAVSRRANVIVNERQITNDRAEGRPGNHLEKEQASRRHIASGSGSRRAAEEDEHVVVQVENGGQVVNSTRVNNGDSPVMAPVISTELSQELHTDPPDALDVEGDVVMEIEDPKGDNQMEGGTAINSV